ncbi:MAG: methylated-DNA--[protein]-cysteine S-methyltransferase [Segniliparus sp.]|uniref:methylated-DNA--[protein]-cysteine S-methyltransferase n=1 Tax=Segniliparus sp. TaxID=2804064 RepID=UPI003F2B5D37
MRPVELAGLCPAEPADLGRLRARLASASAEQALLDVAYRVVDSPLGPLLAAATPEGLVRVAFAVEGHDSVLQSLADRISPRVLEAPARLDPVARQLDDYFSGRLRRFELALDWQLSKGFRRTVLEHLATDVGYGTKATYGILARLSGSPGAVRAVGTACATNPIPLVVPCHRVVRSDGTAGGYRGGAEAKRLLLDLEGSA